MRIVFIIIAFVCSFFLLNYYLFDSFIAIILGIILLFISIFLSLKLFQKKNKTGMFSIGGFILLFCVYAFIYRQIPENNSVISLKPQILEKQTISKFTSEEDFKNCIETEICSEKALFIQDIRFVNKYIGDYSKEIDLYTLATMVSSLKARSELLHMGEINSRERIIFDKKIVLKQYLEQELGKLEKYLSQKNIIKNFYINKEQYFQYSMHYYQDIYNLVKRNTLKSEREEFLKEKYGYNIVQIFVNRKYFYNLMIPQSLIEADIVYLEGMEEKIHEINNLLKK